MPIATNPQTGEKMQWDGNAWVPIQAPPPQGLVGAGMAGVDITMGGLKDAIKRAGSKTDDAVRSIAGGATFEYADEFAAKMNELTGLGGSYEENIQKERMRDEAIPLTTKIPGQIAGGLAAATVAGPYAAATKAGQLFSRLPKWLQTTGLGALWGGGYGSGMAEEGERLAGAGIGAGVGAGAGLAIHGGIAGGKAVYDKAAGYLRARRDPEGQATKILAEKMREDQISPSRMMGEVREMGPQAAFVDAGEENVMGLARGLVGRPGAAKRRIMKMLKGRGEGEPVRVTKATTQYLGPGDAFAAEAEFLSNLSQRATKAWGAAYEANPELVMSPVLRRMLGNPRVQAGIKMASKTAQDLRTSGDAAWLGPVDQELTALARMAKEMGVMEGVGRPGVAKGFSLETWQAVKMGLDQLVKSRAYTNELTGTVNAAGRGIKKMQNRLVKELDRLTGGEKSLYAAARKKYGDDAELVDAIRAGTKFFKLSPEANRAAMAKLSESGQEAYRNGASRAIQDVIEKTPDGASVSRRLFGNQMSRNKIEAVFPTGKGQFQDYSRRLTAEQKMAETKGFIGAGSRTTPMAAEMEDLTRIAGNIGAVAGTKVPGAHALVMSGIVRRYAEKLLGRPEEMETVLAKILSTRNRAEQQRIIDILQEHLKPTAGLLPIMRGTTLAATQQQQRFK